MTSIVVALHEIPQEIGDFDVLVYGGMRPHRRCDELPSCFDGDSWRISRFDSLNLRWSEHVSPTAIHGWRIHLHSSHRPHTTTSQKNKHPEHIDIIRLIASRSSLDAASENRTCSPTWKSRTSGRSLTVMELKPNILL